MRRILGHTCRPGLFLTAILVLLSPCSVICAQEGGRPLPEPREDHPGNVFILGEVVHLTSPAEVQHPVAGWRVRDELGGLLQEGKGSAVRAEGLGVGWYRIEFVREDGSNAGFTTAAVLAALAKPVPQDSPVCLDVALSWNENEDKDTREALARLAALAGANWVRDRMRWRELQPAPGTMPPDTKYDVAADVQHAAGLNVLQVFHGSPAWASDSDYGTGQFPLDLRHGYRFCKAMAARYRGRVQAWEPWNEGNAGNFGGHTMDELCALQKAAWLGFKAGEPAVTVGWNPLGGINTREQVDAVLANETWPYYDTYNIHSYDWPHAYEALWEPSRKAACGRPLWVTECDRGMAADPESPTGDFTDAYDRRKAELIPQSYANSLFSGSVRHFHFILGHYMEQDHRIQFGLLRKDLTPRPSYVALAAAGRLLAGARCLGRWELEGKPEVYLYAFRACPGGKLRDVLVAWTERRADWDQRGQAAVPWPLPEGLPVECVYDYLGRGMAKTPEHLTSAAVYVLLPEGAAEQLPLRRVPLSEHRAGAPSPVVLQLVLPWEDRIKRANGWTQEYYRALPAGEEAAARIAVYNFGGGPVRGEVRVEKLPESWTWSPRHWRVDLEPMERKEFEVHLTPTTGDMETGRWVVLRGDFGPSGKPVVAFRVAARE